MAAPGEPYERGQLALPPHLLIVDDDVDFAESLAEVLCGQPYRVTLARSGPENLAQVAAHSFDLVLLDMKMPGMDGLECLTAMRRQQPGIDVVMITAFTKSELIRHPLQAGALPVLHKPVSVEELLAVTAFIALPASVLVVEDDEDFAGALCGVLTQRRYRVEVVASLAAARAALTRHPAELVLLDYRHRDGTGAELLDWLKTQGRREAVVLLTDYPDAALDGLPCLSAADIMVKPFALESLLEAISKRVKAGKLRRATHS